ALERLRARRLDRLDARVRVHRTDHEGARLPRQIDIIAEAAGAGDEPRIFLAANRRADSHAVRCTLHVSAGGRTCSRSHDVRLSTRSRSITMRTNASWTCRAPITTCRSTSRGRATS